MPRLEPIGFFYLSIFLSFYLSIVIAQFGAATLRALAFTGRARRLKQVFNINIEKYRACSGTVNVVHACMDFGMIRLKNRGSDDSTGESSRENSLNLVYTLTRITVEYT